jgi:exodeoxyribonuclease V alpha subunit
LKTNTFYNNDSERLKAGLLYTLEEECIKQGHTYLDENAVLEITEDMSINLESQHDYSLK